jgi:transcriptional regulator with XRE-family HTH domain
MVRHSDDGTSSRMIGQVLTTSEWHQARELAIALLIPDELDGSPNMPNKAPTLRPRRNLAIGKRLELARIAFGQANAQGKFATAAGIRANTYSMWEIGENFPGLENSMKLCERHAGLTLDWIYFGRVEGMPLWLANAISALMQAEASREPDPKTPASAPVVRLPATAKHVEVVKATNARRRAS